MSVEYQQIDIDKVVKTAFHNFHTTGFDKNCIGTCGIGQGATYYAAIKHGVPRSCIKLCQANDVIQGCRHAFAIIVLEQPYLVDLTFGQYLCLWEKDKKSVLMKEHFPVDKMEQFIKKGYVSLSESFLMIYYRFLRRLCIVDESNQGVNKYFEQTAFDEISLFPTEKKYIKDGSFNLLEMTLSMMYRDWSEEEVDYSVEEIKKWKWNRDGAWI